MADRTPARRRRRGPAAAVDPAREPFRVKDCALIALATGAGAQTLRELRDGLRSITTASIYYHFWGARLRPRFSDREYQNDFARWAHLALHDGVAAERLGVIDPTAFGTLEELRQELIDVIEERLDEASPLVWATADRQFNFLTSQIVVFDTRRTIESPPELAEAIAGMAPSSIFYHVIDARRRTPESVDDFRAWLLGFGGRYRDLCGQLADLDPFFSSLGELRDGLAARCQQYFGGGGA